MPAPKVTAGQCRWLKRESGAPLVLVTRGNSGAAPATVGETRFRTKPLCSRMGRRGSRSAGIPAFAREPGDRPWCDV